MFGLRSKRTTRDRRMGLVFQWRLPVGNHMSFFSAITVVTLISAGLAATVRVRVGGGAPRHPERRGALVFVPRGEEWDSLRTLALEAGPFPVREDPSQDPAVGELVRESLAVADVPGYRYRPAFQPISVTGSASSRLAAAGKIRPGDLPPLPEPEPPVAVTPPRTALQPAVLSANGLRALPPADPPPAGVLQGSRYLLAYGPSGRVLRVTTVFSPQETAAGGAAAVESWLRRVVIEGGEKSGGWAAVEISGGS
jgi:hypothetical protein